MPVRLQERKELSKDARNHTSSLPDYQKGLGLGACQHVQLDFRMTGRMLIRSYTPTHPVLAKRRDGTFELVVKS